MSLFQGPQLLFPCFLSNNRHRCSAGCTCKCVSENYYDSIFCAFNFNAMNLAASQRTRGLGILLVNAGLEGFLGSGS